MVGGDAHITDFALRCSADDEGRWLLGPPEANFGGLADEPADSEPKYGRIIRFNGVVDVAVAGEDRVAVHAVGNGPAHEPADFHTLRKRRNDSGDEEQPSRNDAETLRPPMTCSCSIAHTCIRRLTSARVMPLRLRPDDGQKRGNAGHEDSTKGSSLATGR